MWGGVFYQVVSYYSVSDTDFNILLFKYSIEICESVSSQEAAPIPPRRKSVPMRGIHRDLRSNDKNVPNRSGTLPRQPRTPRYPSVSRAKSHSNADVREEVQRESIKSSARNLASDSRQGSIKSSHQRNVLLSEKSGDSNGAPQGTVARTRTVNKPPLPREAIVTPLSPPLAKRNFEKLEKQTSTTPASKPDMSQVNMSQDESLFIKEAIKRTEATRDGGESDLLIKPIKSDIMSSDSLLPGRQLFPITKAHDDQTNSSNLPTNHQQEIQKSKSLPLLFSFNGKTDGDAKKCWPIDVAVLEDGTPIVTDFHNKKLKAFDPSGCVVAEASVPSWPHGIIDISSTELVVTLPELSTIIFVILKDDVMRVRKRIRTAKQYRGIACDAVSVPGNPCIVVSCCSSGGQCVDVMTVDGVILQTYRDDYRQHGRLLFTWPYYICTNTQGEILVSDCQSRNNLICLGRNGKARYEEPMNETIIRDPRGMCTDRTGNILIADKNGNAIHMLGVDGKYKHIVLSTNDGLVNPIAVCLSPFGQLIVTQENGDIKVFKFN